MQREKELAKNTVILSIGTFLPKMASFITLPILTGYLTKTEYGTYDLITVLVSLLLPSATLQVQAAAFRFLIDARKNREDIKSIITSIVVFIMPISLAALTILYFCLLGQSVSIRIMICLYFWADIMVNATRQICRGLHLNLQYSISAIVSAMGKMVFAVICVYYLRAGLLGTVISLFMASFLSFIFLIFKTRVYEYFDIQSFSPEMLKKMLRYSWPLVPNNMSAWVMRVSDRFVVTAFMGVEANAVYAVSSKIPSLLSLAQTTFTMAWQENASIVSKDEDASEYYTSMFRTMFDLMAGLFGILISLTPLLFVILIHGDYGEAYFQIPVLFLAMFFFCMTNYLGGIYVAYKQSKSVGITSTAAAICNLVVDLALIRKIGLFAASGSTLVSYVFLFVFRLIDVQKIVRVRYSLLHVLAVISIIVLESALCFLQKPYLNILNIILGLIIFAVLNRVLVVTVWQMLMKRLSKK